MCRVAIVAALEREVAPLIRNWPVRTIQYAGRQYRLFENQNAAVICGGMGADAARRATEAIIHEFHPSQILSVGFVGALDPALRAGDIFEPRTVVNASDGVRADTGRGVGTLVSFSSVAGREQKAKLRNAYSAAAVDMEAASVAQAAELRGVAFAVLKAVSDEAGFVMPPLDRFFEVDGKFRSVQFVVHVALRPSLWGTTLTLARNSAKASKSLCAAVEQYLAA